MAEAREGHAGRAASSLRRAASFAAQQLAPSRSMLNSNSTRQEHGQGDCDRSSGTSSSRLRLGAVRISTAEELRDASALLSIRGCEDILRASPLSTLLRRGAAIYKNSAGSARTYLLSKPVDVIDVFVSHNWCISRHLKFLALALHFNFKIATCATLAVTSAMAAISSAGFCPMLVVSRGPEKGSEVGILCQIVAWPVFLFTVVFVRDFLALFGYGGPRCFLDKTCIHQEDLEIQRAGIEKLGAFLRHSQHMICLYSDTYLTKVWTVYEVAAFMSLHSTEAMTVLPVQKCIVLLTAFSFAYVYTILNTLTFAVLGTGVVTTPLVLLTAMAFQRTTRSWAKRQASIIDNIAQFSIQKCSCLDERDRPIVYRNVAVLMKASRVVGSGASTEQALDAFDELVRDELLQKFVQSAGPSVAGLLELFTVGFFGSFLVGIDNLGQIAKGTTVREALCFFTYCTCSAVWAWPIAVLAIQVPSSYFMKLSGLRELLYSLAAVLVAAAAGPGLMIFAMKRLSVAAETSDWALGALVACVPLAAAAAAALERRSRGACEAARSSAAPLSLKSHAALEAVSVDAEDVSQRSWPEDSPVQAGAATAAGPAEATQPEPAAAAEAVDVVANIKIHSTWV